MQVEAAQEIGGVRTRTLLDAPEEIEKYHRGPLRIALCLLAAVLAKYEGLRRDDPGFQDDGIDGYRCQHSGFVDDLRELRDALLPPALRQHAHPGGVRKRIHGWPRPFTARQLHAAVPVQLPR